MRVLFIGTGEIGIPCLRWLAECPDLDLVGLVTQPDRPAGRKHTPTPPPVKAVAEEWALPLIQPERIRDREPMNWIARQAPDLIVVFAFGQILKKDLLDLPRFGCVNCHASLLPRHRGASCIQASLLAGDRETGITLIQMDEGLDTGDCLDRETLPIHPDDTAVDLHDRLSRIAPLPMERVIRALQRGALLNVEPQDERQASYTPRLKREDGELDWRHSNEEIERRIRALHGWPGTYSLVSGRSGIKKRLKIFPPAGLESFLIEPGHVQKQGDQVIVGCGQGSLSLGPVQAEGGQIMGAVDWWRGLGESRIIFG